MKEIFIFEDDEIKLDVSLKEETVWLTQNQMAILFGKDRTVITKHINNVFKENELNEKSNVQNMHFASSTKPVKVYSLDVVISVGYRVKSRRGTKFRIWANKILKDYILTGYAVNKNRLEYLEKTVKLIDIASRIDDELIESKEIIKVISNYSKSLKLLDDYDNKIITKPIGNISDKKITYKDCLDVIKSLEFKGLFGIERNNGLEAIINNVYQTFDNNDLYLSIEEKAANLLYLIVKNHVFIDGNKRIGATLFIYFLNHYNLLFKESKLIIDNNTLTALAILIAQSNPKEKDILIDLVMNFLIH